MTLLIRKHASLFLVCVGALFASSFFTQSVQAEDWPYFRGNAQGTGVAKSVVPDKPALLWKKKIADSIVATAVVADGIIYVGDGDDSFYAIRLSDGKELWKKTFEAGFSSAAAVGNGKVYIGDSDGNFRCLNAKDGTTVWSFSTEMEFYAGPVLHNKNVLFTCDNGTLYCFHASDGTKQWTFSLESQLQCFPTISGKYVALAGCDKKFHLIDLANGKETESLDISGETGTTPAVLEGRFYFGTQAGVFHCVGSSPLKEQWTFHDPNRRQPINSSAAVTKEIVLYGSDGKRLYALNPTTGKLKWKAQLKSRIETSPIISGKKVFVATLRGRLHAFDLQQGKKLWSFDAGRHFSASPVIADGKLVIGNEDGTLYCFGEKPAKE